MPPFADHLPRTHLFNAAKVGGIMDASSVAYAIGSGTRVCRLGRYKWNGTRCAMPQSVTLTPIINQHASGENRQATIMKGTSSRAA